MIIVDEMADVELADTLETLRHSPGSTRCIYFHLMDIPEIQGLRDIVISALEKTIVATDTKLFFCDDKDIYILTSIMRTKDYREFIQQVADLANHPSLTERISRYEVSVHFEQCMQSVESKIRARRKLEEDFRKEYEKAMIERKRKTILHSAVDGAKREIHQRRKARTEAELMIIEDDAFSRRLVENVLQKEYPLTGLGEATHALDTYARLAPNVLFLDINLPDVTGHELLEKIMEIDPEAYVVMLSGNADKENITQAMNKGARGFIAKPFTKEKLIQYIEHCPSIA